MNKIIKKQVEECKANVIRNMVQDMLDDISIIFDKRLEKFEKDVLKIMRDTNDSEWVPNAEVTNVKKENKKF